MTIETATDRATGESASSGSAGQDPEGSGVRFVLAHVGTLHDNPADVRGGDRDPDRLVEFASSIRAAGILQALTVVPVPETGDQDAEEQFVVYAGHRRRDAARLAAAQVLVEAIQAAETTAGDSPDDDPEQADDCAEEQGEHEALDATLVDPGDEALRARAGAAACARADSLLWVPCLVRPDLASAVGMDIASGLIENGVRGGITAGQRARAAEQLSLADGWDVTRIAAATGLTRTQARAAAALPRLNEATRQATYREELSLEHVAALDELDAAGATDDELDLLTRSRTMFDHHAAELRKTLRRRSLAATLLDEVDSRGWTLYQEPEGYPWRSALAPLWTLYYPSDPGVGPGAAPGGREGTVLLAQADCDPSQSSEAAAFASLPGHGVVLHNDPWADPHLEVVCADPEAWEYRRDRRSSYYVETDAERAEREQADAVAFADADAAQAEREAEHQRRLAERRAAEEAAEAQRVAEAARRDALATAAETRWKFTAGLVRNQKAAVRYANLPAVLLGRFPWLLGDADFARDGDEVTALCPDPDRDPASHRRRWTDGRVSHRAVVTAARLLHDNVTAAAAMRRDMIEELEAEPALWWLDYLTGQGYQLAEVETQARASFDEVITECLAAEFGNDPDPEDDRPARSDTAPGQTDQDEPDDGGDDDSGEDIAEDIDEELAELDTEDDPPAGAADSDRVEVDDGF